MASVGTTRITVHLERGLHRALRLRSASSESSVSRIINDAVRRALAHDALDLEAVHARKKERSLNFATVLRGLKRGGRL